MAKFVSGGGMAICMKIGMSSGVYVMAVEANHFGNCDVIKSCSFLINIYIPLKWRQ